MRGVEREHRDGYRHGPLHRYASPEVRKIGGEWDSGRVPQRGGEEGDWIDVRPRRRKALRQVHHGQDSFQEGKRHRKGGGSKLRHERVRYSCRGDCYDGDYDSGSDFADSRMAWGGDRDGGKGYGTAADRRRWGAEWRQRRRREDGSHGLRFHGH